MRTLFFLACVVLACHVFAEPQKAKSAINLDDLLGQVKDGTIQDRTLNQQRLAAFKKDLAQQKQRYADLEEEQKRQESLSDQREKQFEDNDQQITLLQQRLDERLGALKELFGVLQQVSSDTLGQFHGSLTQLHYPDRSDFLASFSDQMGQTSVLPSIQEIEQLWFELQREMTESGKIITWDHAYINQNGEEVKGPVTRVGTFNVVAQGKYLQFVPETKRVVEYARQPSARFMAGAEKIQEGGTGLVPFVIDPTKGQLLGLLVAAPSLKERVSQGGVIGYCILSLGAVALIIALYRLIILLLTKTRIQNQIKHPNKILSNPLGRVLDEYASHKERDIETLELKMGEAVMREVPKINQGLSFLKIIAAVAPLMGLLGTVTGMIITFQAIVLFGAGDPKMMAGGISQALVTTVLGLTVAIPTLLLHSLVQTKAKSITDILEQEAVAIVANKAEQSAS